MITVEPKTQIAPAIYSDEAAAARLGVSLIELHRARLALLWRRDHRGRDHGIRAMEGRAVTTIDRSVLVELVLAFDEHPQEAREAIANALEELGDYERGLADALRRPGVRPPNLISRALARA